MVAACLCSAFTIHGEVTRELGCTPWAIQTILPRLEICGACFKPRSRLAHSAVSKPLHLSLDPGEMTGGSVAWRYIEESQDEDPNKFALAHMSAGCWM